MAIDGHGMNVIAKDERARFELGAFKALGGAYAVMQLVHERANNTTLDPNDLAFREAAAALCFVCASAGNHGLAVAAGAALVGASCRVHLAESVPESFAVRLRNKGARVLRSGARYADAVAAAIEDAESPGHIHLADGSWPGYTHEPQLVMEGYTVMAEELRAHFESKGGWPDTVWLQAGVGGFAAAVSYAIRERWSVQPKIVIVEPESQASVAAALRTDCPVSVTGAESTMGRLDCEIASLLAFDILKAADVSCTMVGDAEVGNTVEQLAAQSVVTTASAAAGLCACWRDGHRNDRHLIFLTEA